MLLTLWVTKYVCVCVAFHTQIFQYQMGVAQFKFLHCLPGDSVRSHKLSLTRLLRPGNWKLPSPLLRFD